MLISVVTWNTQGRPDTNTNKSAALDALCKTYDVVLLQECGKLFERNGEAIAGKTIHCVEQAGSFNPRCSVAVLANSVEAFDVKCLSLTGRPLVWVKRAGLYIGTIHATSGGVGMPDVKGALSEMGKRAGDGGMILGGDFNVDMDSETKELNVGSVSRPDTFGIATQDRPTQKSGGTLDHFAIRNVTAVGKPRVGRISPSDHRYLTATFSWT